MPPADQYRCGTGRVEETIRIVRQTEQIGQQPSMPRPSPRKPAAMWEPVAVLRMRLRVSSCASSVTTRSRPSPSVSETTHERSYCDEDEKTLTESTVHRPPRTTRMLTCNLGRGVGDAVRDVLKQRGHVAFEQEPRHALRHVRHEPQRVAQEVHGSQDLRRLPFKLLHHTLQIICFIF